MAAHPLPETLSICSSNTTAYMAAANSVAVTDRQNEVVLGGEGLPQRGGGRAVPLFNLVGRKRVGYRHRSYS